MTDVVITVDMDKKCAECGKPGAAGSGICMRCITKIIEGKGMRSAQGQAVQRRLNVVLNKIRKK